MNGSQNCCSGEGQPNALRQPDGPEEATDSPPQWLASEDVRSPAGEAPQEFQPPPGATNPLSPRRGPLEDYMFQSRRRTRRPLFQSLRRARRPPPLSPAQLTEPMLDMEARLEPPPLPENPSAKRPWGRRLTRVGIGVMVMVILITGLLLIVIHPNAKQFPAVGDLLSATEGKSDKEANRGPDPLVASTSQALEYNLITSTANPLLNSAERTELITQALRGLRDPSSRQRALHQHEAMGQEMQQTGLSKEAWYAHVAACKKVCSPAFSALVVGHFAKVAKQRHTAVFFNLGDSSLDLTDRRAIQHMVERLPARADTRLLLIGRASKIGDHEFNMALSERRVQAVRGLLIKSGVSPDRIKSFWLGWEQPYLTRELAERLHISTDLYGGNETKLNQSVMLVLY